VICFWATISSGGTYNFVFPKTEGKAVRRVKPKSREKVEAVATPAPPVQKMEPPAAPSTPVPVPLVLNPELEAHEHSEISGFSFGVGGMLFMQKQLTGPDSPPEPTWGGLFEFGYRIAHPIGIDIYAGARHATQTGEFFLHAGADLELYPAGIFSSARPILDVALLFGASNAMAAESNIGTFHGGLRLNFDFNEFFGLNIIARGNLGYLLTETGFVTRF
jgi:hypothetical protein